MDLVAVKTNEGAALCWHAIYQTPSAADRWWMRAAGEVRTRSPFYLSATCNSCFYCCSYFAQWAIRLSVLSYLLENLLFLLLFLKKCLSLSRLSCLPSAQPLIPKAVMSLFGQLWNCSVTLDKTGCKQSCLVCVGKVNSCFNLCFLF